MKDFYIYYTIKGASFQQAKIMMHVAVIKPEKTLKKS